MCCQKVRITLCAKEQVWEAISVNLFKGEQYKDEYLDLNPKGVVPTLVHDGEPVTESTLICEYIDSVFPNPPLVPSDPLMRSEMRAWSKMVDEGLFEGVAAISFSAMFRERMKNAPEEIRQARFRNVGDPRRRDRMESTLEYGVNSPYVLQAVYVYEKAFHLLEKSLSDGRKWIMGDNPTLADISLIPFTARLDYLGLINIWLTERPHTILWWNRVKDWPSYQRGLANLITEAEIIEMQTHGPKLRKDIVNLLATLRDGSWHK